MEKKRKIIFFVLLFFIICGFLFGKKDQPYTVEINKVAESIETKEGENADKIAERTELDEPARGLSETEFKNLCSEIIYNDIGKNSIGTYVYKDLFNWQIKENGNYSCCAIEDFIEELKSYQKTYRNYRVIDCRMDNSFTIEKDDIIRVYGIIDGVSQSYFTGGYNPTIKMYYIEYIRKYGSESNGKTKE